MSDRSENERNVRSLMHHTSGTYLLSLPVEYIRELGWKGKQKLSIELHGKTLVVKDWKRKS